MKTTPATQPLTPELIRSLLTHESRLQMPPEYVRLMEIYCVVKAGGITAQQTVAQRLQETEKAALLTEIQSLSTQSGMESRVQALQQEIQELEKSVSDRLAYLSSIDPHEATLIQTCLPDIDAYFATLGPAGK
ncbi:MAG: hypothetical protein F6K42_05690 [Leptolyngbya sp. SIO1D8]|nr:hypothetical protein [Leptolyngbya sp. SIO1D8]